MRVILSSISELNFSYSEIGPRDTLSFGDNGAVPDMGNQDLRGFAPKDLWTVIGSKSRVSEILAGRRAISKEQAKKLATFFKVTADLFI